MAVTQIIHIRSYPSLWLDDVKYLSCNLRCTIFFQVGPVDAGNGCSTMRRLVIPLLSVVWHAVSQGQKDPQAQLS